MNLDGLNFPNFENPRCAETDPDIFFPDSKDELRKILPTLRQICGGCEHQMSCLDYALVNDINDGVWGGFTPHQRKRMQPDNKAQSQARREVYRKLAQGWTIPQIAKARNTSLKAVQLVIKRAEQEGSK